MADKNAQSFEDFPLSAPSESVGGGEFADFPLSSGGSPVGAFAEQFAGGLAQSSAIAGGAIMGGQIGSLAGPVGTLAGAVVGGGAGYLFGEGAKGVAGVRDIRDVPEDERPYAVAGETLGQSLPFGPAVVGLAKAGVRAAPAGLGNFVNRILEYAGKSPAMFLASESAAAGLASAAGAGAEAVYPNEPWQRFKAEMAAGFFSPARLITNVSSFGANVVSRVVKQMTPGGRSNRAAQILQEAVRIGGDDPEAIAAILSQPDALGLHLTTAQKSGSATLAALEASLAENSAKFGAEQKKVAESALASLRNMVEGLRGTGDPKAMAHAAEIRSMQVRGLIQARVQQVEAEAVKAAEAISMDDPRARAELSKQASTLLSDSLKEMRDVERSLWSAVPKLQAIEVKGIAQGYARLRTEMLPEEKLSPIIEEFVSRMKSQDLLTDAGEVIRFRSRALALARESASQGKFSDARAFGQLAESALDDLQQLKGKGGDAYDAARTFSRELHDVYTRSFGGDALATASTGELRIPPEMMLERAVGSGGTGADVRLQDLENLTSFLTRQGLSSPEAANRFGKMLDAQSRIIALAASEGVNPATGRADVGRLSRFLSKNQGLLDRFPEVRSRIEAALDMEQRAQRVAGSAKKAERAIEKGAAFAKLENVESATDAIKAALRSASPEADLTAIARVAKRGGQPAVLGLRSAIIDHALNQATSESGVFSFAKFRAAMVDAVKPGLPSVSKVMASEGVIDSATLARMNQIVDKAAAIETSLKGGVSVEEILKNNPDALVEMALRITGARVGSAVSSAMGGGSHSLIAASAGSKFIRQAFEKLDHVTVTRLLREAMSDPKLAAALLEKPTSQADAITKARNIHAYALSASLSVQDDRTK